VATKKKAPPRKAAGATRKAKEARALRNRLIFGGLLIVLAGVVVFAAARPEGGGGGSVDDQLQIGAGSCTTDRNSDPDAKTAAENHVPNPTYEVDPPAGGPHLDRAANPGFYTESNLPKDGELVHAQEHGFVVLWYQPDRSNEKRRQLEQLSDNLGRELIVVPRASLPGEVAVTAWHHRMLCGELVPEKVALFTRSYVDQGPEKGFL
jgi:hypothetical protein